MYLATLLPFAGAVLALPAEGDRRPPSLENDTITSPGFPLESEADFVSKTTGILGFVNGTSVTGECGKTYNRSTHSACVAPELRHLCGRSLQVWRDGRASMYPSIVTPPWEPGLFEDVVEVVDICPGPTSDLKITWSAWKKLGGSAKATIEDLVFWKALPPCGTPGAKRCAPKALTRRANEAHEDPAAIHQVDVINPLYEFSPNVDPRLRKRDLSSASSFIFGGVDGGSHYGSCQIPYTSESLAACVSPTQRRLCGSWLLASANTGTKGKKEAKVWVADICDRLQPDQLDFTGASYLALGGALRDEAISQVQYKVLDEKPRFSALQASAQSGVKGA